MNRLKSYNWAESDQILQLALGSQAGREQSLTHADLVRAASELGISEAAVSQGEQLLREQQSELADWEEFKRHERRTVMKAAIPVAVWTVAVGILKGWDLAIEGSFAGSVVLLTTVLGIIFSGSTQTERKFQGWRKSRRIRTEHRGKDTLQIILRRKYDDGECTTRGELTAFLLRMNLSSGEAERRVEEFIRLNPTLVIPFDQAKSD